MKETHPGCPSPSQSPHLALDVGGDAEEQRPVEGELDHVVPVLGGQHALGTRDRLGGSSVSPRGVWSPSVGTTWVSRGPPNPQGCQETLLHPQSPLLMLVLRKSRGLAAGMGSTLTWMGYPFHTSRRS